MDSYCSPEDFRYLQVIASLNIMYKRHHDLIPISMLHSWIPILEIEILVAFCDNI